jgi:hypothetical protein
MNGIDIQLTILNQLLNKFPDGKIGFINMNIEIKRKIFIFCSLKYRVNNFPNRNKL